MPKNTFTNVWKRITGIHKDCQGFVVMSTLAIFLFLFILCASIYAVGETIHQRIKIQNACDAAAYSAAVVQADGLSRMAVVNRAMTWSYIQMTNRQMDYITYRWLKLTCKRFQEDKKNANDYAEQVKAAIDPEIGWWALLEAVATAALDGTLQIFGIEIPCVSGGHNSDNEGLSWWCGRNPDRKHEIKLNMHKDFSISNLGSGIVAQKILNYETISSLLSSISFIDKDDTPAGWGHWLGKLIDYDKKNIYRLNKSLERINTQMEISMKMTAENVLKTMLKDNRYDSKSVLKDYYISIRIPHAENPYDIEKGNNSFFSPLHNTEADEMLFLNMQSADFSSRSLHQHFPTLTLPGGNSLAYGLDQWFIRGCGKYNKLQGSSEKEYAFYSISELTNVSLNGSERNEGALGIQRVYKDSNINEGKAGIWNYRVNRGNSITSLDDMIAHTVNSDDGGILGALMESALSSLLGNLSQGYMNIAPSCENKVSKAFSGSMCQEVDDTTALYAEYSWASAKWFCLTRARWLDPFEIIDKGGIYCDLDRKHPWYKSWGSKKKGGFGHWGFPKWFCGDESGWWVIPPIFGNSCGESHGYMKHTLDFNMSDDPSFFTPLRPLWRGKPKFSTSGNCADYPRDKYESCATFIDGTWRISPGSSTPAAYIRGHARIYADDKAIFDNRYIGAVCKPWVLNERFFAGEGTIVVGAAMKHTNPFVQLFNFWNTKKDDKKGTYAIGTETQKNSEKTVLSAFNIPEGNYMWTMSAARAGVRHHRRNGAYDQERQYQITYDSTSDAENLSYNSGPCIKKQGEDRWTNSTEGWDHEGNNPYALSRINFPGQKEAPVWNGCPCNQSINPTKFKNMWNLCETDWDATLLPLRYALQTADLYLNKGSGSSIVEGLKLNDQNYDERIGLIEIAYDYSEQEADGDPHKVNDSIIGNGENWMWRQTTMNNATLTNAIILFQKNGWKKADQPFWKDLFKNLTPEEMQQIFHLQGQDNLNLYNKIPEGKEMLEVNPFTLLNQKVL